jgi:hypothetical protein
MNYTEQEYRRDVAEIARRSCAEIGHLEEAVESTQWIIYHAGTHAVMEYTDNEDAFFNGDASVELFEGLESFKQTVARFAFQAMLADVLAAREEQGLKNYGFCRGECEQ